MNDPSAEQVEARTRVCPAVSAYVPAYNAASTIARALASVYAQTYENIIEVIVVDDGSTDGTAQVVRDTYPDAILIEQANVGQPAARNTAVRAARAEYITSLDADDEWLPDKLQRQMRVLTADPRIDFCGCLAEVVTPGGRRTRPAPERPGMTAELEFAAHLKWEYPIVGALVTGRRECLLSVGGYDESLRAFVDRDLWSRVLAAGHRLVMLQEHLYRWYLYPESVCHGQRGLAKHDSELRILDKWDPERVSSARGLVTPEDHAELRRRALLNAALDHARYAQYQKARDYATRGLALAGGGLRHRTQLSFVAQAPAAYGACARAMVGAKNVARRLLGR